MIPQDLRLRLLVAFALVVGVTQLEHLASALAGFAFSIALALAAGTEPRLWRRLLHVEGIVAILLITLPFTVPGTPLFRLGPLTASAEGLLQAVLVACKISAAVVIVLSVLGTAEPMRLGAALHALRLPEPIVRLLVLTLRYLSVIRGEARRLHDAMRMRGFRPRSNRHTWRSYGNLVGMLLVRALERANRVEEAMRCRGCAGRFPYAILPPPARRDWIAFALLLAVPVAGTILDRT